MTRFAGPSGLLLAGVAAVLLGACAGIPRELPPPVTRPDPAAQRLPPIPAQQFTGVNADQEVLGELQVLFTRHENTFVEIARRHDLGYDELQYANPAVDAWLPGEATPVYLPTMTIIPQAPREGIVLNVPSMRLLYFEPGEGSSPGAETTYTVSSHPIGIGREGWATPLGKGKVTSRAVDPTWYPPASIRAEHAKLGDPLPAVVPPGPDNPLGRHAFGLSMSGYLIHGTNLPAGVGMRSSHGCIRMYPEDIEALFDRIPVGTPVTIVDQPVLAGWRDGQLYLEVHPPLNEDTRDLPAEAERVIAAALERAGQPGAIVDSQAIATILAERNGMPAPVLAGQPAPADHRLNARLVVNDIPAAIEAAASR